MLFKFVLGRKKKRLGEQLCTEIRRLEEDLQENLRFQTLRDLLEVYSVRIMQRAIEFFEATKDMRYKTLGEQMQKLLAREDIRKLIERPEDSPRPARHFTAGPLEDTPGRELNRHSSFSLSTLIPEDRAAESLIHTGLSLSACTSKKLHADFASQQTVLRSKLANRLKRKQCASLGNSGDGSELSISESDRSAGRDSCFERELERVMEAYVEEKMSKARDINAKYEEQIAELSHAGQSGIIAKVVQQMKETQQIELLKLVQDVEIRRKAAIAALRQKFLLPSESW